MPRNDDRTRKDLEFLGLEISASEDDKKKAFIKLALKLHPDRFSKNPDDATKMRFHEVCKAYKRLTSDHCSTADWNIDKSDEIFFSLLADSLQHNSKTALYELFSELPNHKSHFQSDNEYRIKEDVFDEEDEDTEFNRLIKILMNRLQNGKSLPAGLTQDKICKLKEDFVKQREASKRCTEDEKTSNVGKKSKPPQQVPVTKPKPKSKKQILAEQRRREREMAKIAEELDEKKKREGEKENARRQMESEKQRKLEEEQRKLEEDRKRLAQEAKKKKEREDRERELRQQKENERLEKLKKQQEEESRRKEEEKKRKAEEKAAKSKAAREAKEREEKEKLEQAKKQQNNKRSQAQFQQQYQSQYQQQQQKYPREVPPRFLRQMQQRQQPNSNSQNDYDDSSQQNTSLPTNRKDQKPSVDDSNWDKDSNDTTKTVEKSHSNRVPWSENTTVGHENWGQELSNSAGSLSDWGTVTATEDWDAPSDSNFTDWTETVGTGVNNRQDIVKKDDTKTVEPTPIGSEVKSGKIPKKENISVDNRVPTSGQFGAIGQPVISSNSEQLDNKQSQNKPSLSITLTEKCEDLDRGSNIPIVNKNLNKEPVYRDAIERNRTGPTEGQSSGASHHDMNGKKVDTSRSSETPSPKLTGWSGLDGFDSTPIDSAAKTISKTEAKNIVSEQSSLKTEGIVNARDKDVMKSQTSVPPHAVKDIIPDKVTSNKVDTKLDSTAVVAERSTRESDEWGWTTASSKKTKQKSTVQSTPSKEANVWTSRALKQLLDMGFQREEAERALKENNGIIESAVSDLLSRTDVDKLQVQNAKSKQNDQVTSTLNELGKNPSISKDQNIDVKSQMVSSNVITGSPDKLNRKQRRKQIQGKSNEDIKLTDTKVNSVINEPSPDIKTNVVSHAMVDQRPVLPEQSGDSKIDKAPIMKDPISQPGQDIIKPKPKSVGVIGGQLPSTSVNKISSSQTSPSSANPELPKDILGSLKMNVSAPNAPESLQQSSSQHPLSHLRQLGASGPSVIGSSSTIQQGKLPNFQAEGQQSNPTQTARIQYILQQQLAQMRGTPSSGQPHTPADSLLQQRQQFTQSLVSADKQLPAVSTKSQPPLTEQVYVSASLPANIPAAPQVSKLHQWTQPLNRGEPASATPVSQPEAASTWNGPASSSNISSVSSAMGAVTVDPVSAKWGVLAAPRLSPTPCEFKPGVPWKPKAELEKGDRKLSGEEFSAEIPNEGEQLASAVKEPSKTVIRPPPGLNSANAFQEMEPKLEVQKPDLPVPAPLESRLLCLKGLSPKVDHQSLRIFCQQYGIVVSYTVGQGSAFVCFENASQAQNARKSMNGVFLFDSNIKTELIPEENRSLAAEVKGINTQPANMTAKPFLPSHYPAMPVQSFWDTNGQIGHMNPSLNPAMAPNMNPNIALAPGHPVPVTGLPPTGVLGMNPQLGPWVSGRTEPVVNSSHFWPMNAPPQGLLSQVTGYGQWSGTTSQPLTAANASTYAAVSPSASAKLLPDGLFNGSESM